MTVLSYRDLRKYCYFSSLTDSALEAISGKLTKAEFSAGTMIISEGAPSDAFYLLCNGEVEVVKKTRWGQPARLSVMSRGDGFGEMALLTCSPRCCSVKAKTDVTLLRLDKAVFEEIVRNDSAFSELVEKRVQGLQNFNRLKTLQPFALLPPEKMTAVPEKLVEEQYPAGKDIIVQGEKGDKYFIIKSGRVSVFKKDAEDVIRQVAELSEGEGFGEEALITDDRRNATVRAADDTVVLTLSRSDFDDIMKSSHVREASPEEILSSSTGAGGVIDVRMEMEFDEEHLPDAINIPLDKLRSRCSGLDPSREYYVYCLVGARSATASFIMNSQGLNAKSIKGGISNWPGRVVEGKEGVHTPFKPT